MCWTQQSTKRDRGMNVNITLCMGCMEFYDAGLTKCPFCGLESQKGMERSDHLDPGTVLLNRYIVGKVLHISGQAVSYIGYDTSLDKKVIIEETFFKYDCEREPSKDIVPGPRISTKFEKYKKAIIEEGNRIHSLRNIPAFTAMNLFEAHNTVYMIWEYIHVQLLSQYLSQKGGKLSLHESLILVSKVLCGVEKMHLSGLCHRAINPSAIGLTDSGEIKILGLYDTEKISFLKKGKGRMVYYFQPGYAPPEVYHVDKKGLKQQGTWTDVYSVAAILYRMVMGGGPIDAFERLSGRKIRFPSEIGIQIPQTVERAMIRGLEVDIRARIKDVQIFRNELFC